MTEENKTPNHKCDVKQLTIMAYTNGFTLWHYRASLAVRFWPDNYFDTISDGAIVKGGDRIMLTAPDTAGDLIAIALPNGKIAIRPIYMAPLPSFDAPKPKLIGVN